MHNVVIYEPVGSSVNQTGYALVNEVVIAFEEETSYYLVTHTSLCLKILFYVLACINYCDHDLYTSHGMYV